MTKRLSIASAVLTVLAAILASMLVVAVPAFAAPQADGGSKDAKAQKTEDSDRGDHDGDADSDPDKTAKESTNEEDGTTASDPDGNNHPSGKDRSVENTWDGDKNPNQGKAESNPDDTNGPRRAEGVEGEDDKPNAGGGEDTADQDGNNGCGNDDDFDDDNNGWCGKPTENDSQSEDVCDADKTMPGIQKCEKDDDDDIDEEDEDVVLGDFTAKPLPDAPVVLGTRIARGLTRPAVPRAAVAPRVIRGERVAGGVLPFTGGNPLSLMLIALGILASGAITLVATRK